MAVLAIVAVGVRQLTSNAAVPAPWSDAEAALAVNAYALPRFFDLRVPSSVSDTVTSWQVAGYSYLTSATGRHELLVGSTREFVIVASVLTAALTVGVCRRLRLGWVSTAAAVALAGVPTAGALVRIVSVPAAVAAFWLAVAALSALLVADRRPRRPGQRRGRASAVFKLGRLALIVLSAAASAIAVITAGVTIVLLLGLLLGFASTRRLDGKWNLASRGLAVIGLSAALVVASWVTVWGPSAQVGDSMPIAGLGAAVALGGLVIAAACSPIPWLRPLALGAVPILLAASWPGPAQAPAIIVSLTIVAVLAAGLLDHLVRELRPSAAWLPAAATLVVAVTVGAFVLPAPAPASATTTANEEVATWIRTQLAPDAVVAVEPLNRAQLVRHGLDPARLTTAGEAGDEADFLLAPLETEADLPLVARFGTEASALGLRLVVPDPAAFMQALVADQITRSRFGNVLATNPNLILGTAAEASLEAGRVDARLMIGLVGASSYARFAIEEFTGSTGDPDFGTILREATLTDISAIEPESGTTAARGWLAEFFLMQQQPFRPLTVVEGDTSLTVRYAAPSPLGLLP